jgi:flagellar assembly protein FliH
MSSSTPKPPRVPETSLFTYAKIEASGQSTGAPSDARPVTSAVDGEQIRLAQAAAFEQGRQSGQQQARSEFEAGLVKNREQIVQALREFGLERQNYYQRIEAEVVQLALAIARKILHRETQIDPNALAGIVRVTLEKLDSGTKVSLHVHPQEAAQWRHYFACQADNVPAPDVFEDAALVPGECRVETSVGSTEIGLQSQLKEIETGLLDLLAERPVASSATSPPSPPNSLSHAQAAGSH